MRLVDKFAIAALAAMPRRSDANSLLPFAGECYDIAEMFIATRTHLQCPDAFCVTDEIAIAALRVFCGGPFSPAQLAQNCYAMAQSLQVLSGSRG